MSTIPSEQECMDILMAQGTPERIIKHVCTVTRLAVAIARRCGADVDLVRAGGMLHDIGRSRTHTILHGVEGESIARSLSLPEPLVLIIRKHIGAGILPEEARMLGLPELDYVPSTMEEKIVCHADNLVGDGDYLTSALSYEDFVRKGIRSSGDRMLAMHRELSAACGADIDTIVEEVRRQGPTGPCARYLGTGINGRSG